jgi:hypothetical protein
MPQHNHLIFGFSSEHLLPEAGIKAKRLGGLSQKCVAVNNATERRSYTAGLIALVAVQDDSFALKNG